MKIRIKSEVPRDTTLNIRVSQEEKQILKRLASESGLSVSAYIMGLVKGMSPI